MKRKKRLLATTEWNFWPLHEAPPEQHRFAWIWELDRDLASGNPPYLSLPNTDRKRHALYLVESLAKMKRRPVVEANLADILRYCYEAGKKGAHYDFVPHFLGGAGGSGTTHLLTFNWEHFSREKILEAVGNWIDSKPNYILNEGRLGLAKKTGRPESYVHRLIDLAILRLSQAGVTQKQGVDLLKRTMPNPLPDSLPDPKNFTPSHWSDAKRQAERDIRTRKTELLSVASNIGGNWRDWFVKLPTN
jgi:hypothetical protein